uniref:NADH-ubiquinone oxidoreductase chain 3 n=1 Tax=Turritopsis dohrnii TaxID=308579 RepID=A0A1B0TFW0_9CNID|nr:NADH dehydrogenase subunit 3 [Turritopsis dohrnii]ALK27156.1 NADH dehydrogenase subunit 3 [Turritopsis dohrnii]AMK47857.1 NADH dehydrogenase subunit 3 [Turritopsis dohrnii]
MNLEYTLIILALFVSILLSFLISFLSFILTEKSPDKEKVSVYECGFDPFHTPGEPFSIRFFLIAILFLVFDLEISYLFPWSSSSNIINFEGQFIIILFIIILAIGLIYEWIKGGLEWE